jgi:uncharacterized membrane protein (UPF0127 family)
MRPKGIWVAALAFLHWPEFVAQRGATLRDGQRVEAVFASNCASIPGGSSPIGLTIAQSEPFQRKGLSKRKKPLDENEGMLFFFQPKRIGEIWMKDTWIPLQLVHIDPNGAVMKIQEMEVERDPSQPTKIYRAWPAVDAVLELKPRRLKPSQEGQLLCVRSK